jgi:hypothetical protein
MLFFSGKIAEITGTELDVGKGVKFVPPLESVCDGKFDAARRPDEVTFNGDTVGSVTVDVAVVVVVVVVGGGIPTLLPLSVLLMVLFRSCGFDKG